MILLTNHYTGPNPLPRVGPIWLTVTRGVCVVTPSHARWGSDLFSEWPGVTQPTDGGAGAGMVLLFLLPSVSQCFTNDRFGFWVVVLTSISLRMGEVELSFIPSIGMLTAPSWPEWLSQYWRVLGVRVEPFLFSSLSFLPFLGVNLKITWGLLLHSQ